MNLGKFIKEHQSTWARLEHLLQQISDSKPNKAQIDKLGSVYRLVSAHLAYAQTYFPQHEITDYLKHLVIRTHNIIYGVAKKSYWKPVVHFFTTRFPQYLFQRLSFFTVSALILFGGFLLAFVLTYQDQSYAAYFLPADLSGQIDPDKIGQNDWNPALASSEIMVNNIQVALLCFALGALLGIGTIWMLFYNGLLIGALAALFHRAGHGYEFWAFIWPHGVIELTAIFIAGAAGLSLAYHFLIPGDRTRSHALKQEGKVTIQLVFGVIPMFVIAAIIEGFVTPAKIPHLFKYILSLIHLLLLIIYFARPFVWPKFKPKKERG
ncbi:stage II sporulation protein M [Thermoflavimicrobium dichotomicum]|uniref:Uncharacterized membrane protein SpoIIM, required for sporulation n=1 Tax=Thermoflavimicrobium dichotomicum TaxID=46223 RepID=A0A1I3RU72_9BACL|nr:stage II sporulation protein M [Thermoflavimicrobium dichotomicum]SFJ50104.1 Uncharacterized membrane protein SpoIIM, required for sporulation [Thermoflavimicrobium dichotomicum]